MPTPPRQPAGCLLGFLANLLRPPRGAAASAAVSAVSAVSAVPFPYRRRKYLLSPSERAFLRVLEGALPPDTRIFCQLPLSKLLYLPKGTDQRYTWHNKIDRKTVDFVLVDTERLQPLLAIELDDVSHQHPRRTARDDFVNQALATADLPLLHIPAARTYNQTALRERIHEAMTTSRLID